MHVRTRGGAWEALGLALLVVAWNARWLFDGSPVFRERDGGFHAVALGHLQEALLGRVDWRAAPLGWPLPDGTARADWMLGQAVLTLPPRLLGVDPGRVYELASLGGLVLTALGAWALARRLVGPGFPAVLVGFVAAQGPLHGVHLAHANLVNHGVGLFAAYLLWRAVEHRSVTTGFVAGALGAGAAHFGLYMGLHAGLLVGATAIGLAIARTGDARTWAAVALGAATGAVTLLPVWGLYGGAAGAGSVPAAEMISGSWDPAHTFAFTTDAPLHTWVAGRPEGPLANPTEAPNPGFLLVVLAIVGLVANGRPRGAWAVVLGTGVVAAALASGDQPRFAGHDLPLAGPHAWLSHLTGGNLREPSRWLWVAHLAVALYAAAGLRAIARRLGRAGVVVGVLAVGVAAAEVPFPGPDPEVPLGTYFCALEGVEAGAVHDAYGRGCRCDGVSRLRAALFHGRPLVGGNFARYIPTLASVNRLLATWPSPGARALLRATDVRVVIEHPPLRGPAALPDCVVIEGHRVCTLPAGAEVPASAALAPGGGGPVIALRWPEAPRTREVVVTCDGAATSYPVDAWEVLGPLRGAAGFEIVLDAPCDGTWAVSRGEPEALRLVGTSERWLPPVPPSGRGFAGVVGCGEGERSGR